MNIGGVRKESYGAGETLFSGISDFKKKKNSFMNH